MKSVWSHSFLLRVGLALCILLLSASAGETLPRGVMRGAFLAEDGASGCAAELEKILGAGYAIRTCSAGAAKAFKPHVLILFAGDSDATHLQGRIDEYASLSTGPRILVCSAKPLPRDFAEANAKKNVGVIELKGALQDKAVAEALASYVQSAVQRPEEGSVNRASRRTLDEIDRIYATMPPVEYMPPADRWKYFPRTARILKNGGTLRLVMLGDSIVADTYRSAWDLLLERRYPNVRVQRIASVRGSTGCWWYKEPGRVETFVLDHAPDLVMIGGISQRDDIESIRDVIRQIRSGSNADILLLTGPFGKTDPRDPNQWQETVAPDSNHYRARLGRLAAEEKVGFFDIVAPWGRYIRKSGKDLEWFKRDAVHANDRGEQILARTLEHYFSPQEAGFVSLFDGKTLNGWTLRAGRGRGYIVEGGKIVCPADGGGFLFTEKEYSNFVLRFEFLMEPGGNNGIGIRAPFGGNPSVQGMEIQILDDQHPRYKGLIRPEQHHGSVYGVIPARTGFLKPAGDWNDEKITADGRRITVILNGVIILDADLDIVREPEVLKKFPGVLRTSGHIGLLGHDTRVEFRNIRLKELP